MHLCQLIWLLNKGKKLMQKINQTKNQLMFIVWKERESVIIISPQTVGIWLPLITKTNYSKSRIFLSAFNFIFILNSNLPHYICHSSFWNYILYLVWNFKDSKTCHAKCTIQHFFLRTWNLCLWICLSKEYK